MEFDNVVLGFIFTLIAGLSTGIGSAIAFFAKRANTKFLSASLGFSAGVMIYVSFMELMPTSLDMLKDTMSTIKAEFYMISSFFIGIGFIALIDFLVPEDQNPHEIHEKSDLEKMKSLKRTGLMTALAIGIHNFPEGMATFTTAIINPSLAVPIMVAIAIHNIPEGIAVSVPIFHATGKRRRAFWLSFLSGMAEPLGALVGFLFLLPFWTPVVGSAVLSFISGIMIYISFDELLPNTERFGHHHLGITGVVLGMAVMASTLLIL